MAGFIRRLFRDRLTLACVVFVSGIVVVGMMPSLITKQDPNIMDLSLMFKQPSSHNPLGADNYGRDVLARLVHGLRRTLTQSLLVTGITSVLSVCLLICVNLARPLEVSIMRCMDIQLALPVIVLALFLVAILGPGDRNLSIALVIVYTPHMVRVLVSQSLQIRNMAYIEAAEAAGAGRLYIIIRHILPNCTTLWLVQATFFFAYAILDSAALSFLGLGNPPPEPTLGNIISEGRDFISYAPWISLAPGLLIAAIIVSLNVVGDRVRDILDPRVSKLT